LQQSTKRRFTYIIASPFPGLSKLIVALWVTFSLSQKGMLVFCMTDQLDAHHVTPQPLAPS
jgi:hypothetical protein